MHLRVLAFALLLSEAMASLIYRDTCASGYALCAPAGATSINTPRIGSEDFLSLFTDIVSSSLPSSSSKRRALDSRAQTSLCCNALLSCLVMSKLAIPFCYDRFTTNYYLPDASFGTVVGGAYTSSGGDTANLETGDFKLVDGTTGNIYSANPALKPNLATLPIPSQFTASGVGPVVAASSLGVKVTLTYTTTLAGTTIAATTLSASTVPAHISTTTILLPATITTSVSNAQIVSVVAMTSYSQIVVLGGPVPATTIQATTVAGVPIPATTLSASTLPAHTSTQTILLSSTITTSVSNTQIVSVVAVTSYSQISVAGTLVPATTIQATTIDPKTVVVTTTTDLVASASVSSSASVATTSKKSGGEGRWKAGMGGVWGGVVVGLGGCLL